MATILDGKAMAAEVKQELTAEVADFVQNNGVVPCLTAVLVGEDPASQVYVRNKRRACEAVGIEGKLLQLPATVTEDELLETVADLNQDDSVHGILVQLPLPDQIRSTQILHAILPCKDVDAFHPENVGRLIQGTPRFLPCTPQGVLEILTRGDIETRGKHAVVLGRSDIVGKPLAAMLAARGPRGDATVTICHSKTVDIAQITKQGDILVAAIGQPNFVVPEMVKPGATVIDVGINRLDGKLVGDVDFAGVSQVAGAITPVPGGVGPLTVAMLLRNTLTAAAALEAS